MPPRDVRRDCPYCGNTVVLDECPIVCTATAVLPGSSSLNGSASTAFDAGFADTADDTQAAGPPSGATVYGRLGKYPVIHPSRTPSRKDRLARAMTQLTPVEQRGDPRDLPRRACPNCFAALPAAMDLHDAYILSVVGLNRAGKTYFLGSTLYAATRNDALAPYGIESVTPLGDTAQRLHTQYALPLFNDHVLPTTPRYEHLERGSLTFRVSMRGGPTFVLVTHDVSGEALMSENDRAVTAGFVRRADALIFLADPADMPYVMRQLPNDASKNAVVTGVDFDRNLNQSALLQVILDELAPSRRRPRPPLAVTVSKSDLISDSFRRPFRFAQQTDLVNWQEDCRQVHVEVRDLLAELGENSLVRLADQFGSSSFHAVSVLGPGQVRGTTARPAPVRVLDPLGTVLNWIAHNITAASGR